MDWYVDVFSILLLYILFPTATKGLLEIYQKIINPYM